LYPLLQKSSEDSTVGEVNKGGVFYPLSILFTEPKDRMKSKIRVKKNQQNSKNDMLVKWLNPGFPLNYPYESLIALIQQGLR